MNIVMISDVHLGAVGSEDRLENIVSKINSVEADLVCIAGDLFDTDFESVRDPEKARKTLKGIKSKYGVYMCPGNHDAGNTAEKMQDFAESCNITVLNDEYTVIDNRLLLVGRLDTSPIGGYLGLERKELSKVMEGAPKELPVVVLDHNPVNVDTYGKEADLVLCGHTHQGQLFPANIITDIIYTVDHGYYRKDDSSPHVIVTSGVGTWGMPMRVGTDSEIIVVDFEF